MAGNGCRCFAGDFLPEGAPPAPNVTLLDSK
jgi:hypothetical protein